MKKLATVLFISILVACGEQGIDDDMNNATNQSEENSSVKALEQTTMPLEEVEASAVFTATMNSEEGTKDLYVHQVDERVEISNDEFKNFIFFLADPNDNDDQAIVQTDLSIYENSFDELDNVIFDTVNLDGQTFLMLIETVDEHSNKIMMWTVQNNELKEITFNEERTLHSYQSGDVFVKMINNHYIQSLEYKNSKDKGWYFVTWEFDSEQLDFTPYFQKEYTGEEEHDLEAGAYIADKWIEYEDYYSQFPLYTFTEQDKDKILKGYLLDSPFPLGTKVEVITEQYPVFEEGYLDGAPYYEIPGALYYYNEETEITSVLSIGGDRIANPNEIEEILGKPKSSGRSDMHPDEIFSLYEWDQYLLWLFYNEDHELKHIELHSNTYK